MERIGARYSVSQSSSVAGRAAGRMSRVRAQPRSSTPFSLQGGAESGQDGLSYRGVHQQGFHGVAGAVTLGLGVHGNDERLVEIRRGVDVDMADAVQVLDHRHPGIPADPLDQALAPARDDDVDRLGHGDHGPHRRPVRRRDHLDPVLRQPGPGQTLSDTGGDRLIGLEGLGAPTQHGRVAGLQAKAGRVRGHIGPGLVDDADHPQGHPHTSDLNAGGPVVEVGDGTHRVRQGGDLAQALDHGIDTARGQLQPVQECRIQTLGGSCLQVLAIGGGDCLPARVDGIRNGDQGQILVSGACASQGTGGGAGAPTQIVHVAVDVVDLCRVHGVVGPASACQSRVGKNSSFRPAKTRAGVDNRVTTRAGRALGRSLFHPGGGRDRVSPYPGDPLDPTLLRQEGKRPDCGEEAHVRDAPGSGDEPAPGPDPRAGGGRRG